MARPRSLTRVNPFIANDPLTSLPQAPIRRWLVSSTHAALIDKLAQLERADELNAAIQLLSSQKLSANEFASVAIALYRSELSGVPFLTAEMLINNGIDHWILHA